jgi:excisionase family DNA binding protein
MLKNNDLISKNKKYFSTSEVASLLGVSRIAIFKKIKSGQIKAEKIGRNYVIPREEYESILGVFISDDRKKYIEEAVDHVFKKYGPALRKLGKE